MNAKEEETLEKFHKFENSILDVVIDLLDAQALLSAIMREGPDAYSWQDGRQVRGFIFQYWNWKRKPHKRSLMESWHAECIGLVLPGIESRNPKIKHYTYMSCTQGL